MYKLRDPESSLFKQKHKVYRDGIELEKGVVLTDQWLRSNQSQIEASMQLFSAYPDIYLDLIRPANSNFSLFPYQRLMLRAMMRYRRIYITAARASAKTFISILAKFMQCIFVPGHRTFIVAPNIQQGAKVFSQKLNEILAIWPLLNAEVDKLNIGKDYCDLTLRNGSKFSVVGQLDSSRGLRNHSGFLDEARDLDGELISEVILPQLNVSRRLPDGTVNPYEKINQQVVYCTSAGAKSSYAYSALLDIFEDSIINPHDAITLGLDYKIPAMHGLIDSDFVNKLKNSPSYDEATFAIEYMSCWSGGSEESWFKFENLQRYRKLKNPEWHQNSRDDGEEFYLLSGDIGRLGCATVICAFKVTISNAIYTAKLVNIHVLGRTETTKQFSRQALDIKKLIDLYRPREVVIDTNGLGIGIADEMIKTQTDIDGTTYPPYGFFNDADYKRIQPTDAPQILYSMKANGPLNSLIHSAVYSRLNSGRIKFLISEQEARGILLSTREGQRMSTQDRIKRLLPHELTTKLFEEMANLRLRRAGLDIVLEQINTHYPKDKYSAFSYGIWRIKELEETNNKRMRRGGTTRQLVFFTGGN